MKDLLRQIGTAFENLSSREQGLVVLMCAALFAMVLGFGGYFVNRDLAKRDRRIAAKAEKLVEIGALRSDYKRRLAEQNRLAGEVRRNNNVRILSYLEGLATAAGLTLRGASERQGEATGSDAVKEEAAEVRIDDVSLDRLNDFLHRIETGNPLVKVRRLKIKNRFDNKQRLDAVVTVGTYKTTS
jgi:hypothetical protein